MLQQYQHKSLFPTGNHKNQDQVSYLQAVKPQPEKNKVKSFNSRERG